MASGQRGQEPSALHCAQRVDQANISLEQKAKTFQRLDVSLGLEKTKHWTTMQTAKRPSGESIFGTSALLQKTRIYYHLLRAK